jgi:hypothetical protein
MASWHGSIKAFPFQKLPKTTCGDQAHARFHSSDDRLQTITADHPLSRGEDWRVLKMEKVLRFFREQDDDDDDNEQGTDWLQRH